MPSLLEGGEHNSPRIRVFAWSLVPRGPVGSPEVSNMNTKSSFLLIYRRGTLVCNLPVIYNAPLGTAHHSLSLHAHRCRLHCMYEVSICALSCGRDLQASSLPELRATCLGGQRQ